MAKSREILVGKGVTLVNSVRLGISRFDQEYGVTASSSEESHSFALRRIQNKLQTVTAVLARTMMLRSLLLLLSKASFWYGGISGGSDRLCLRAQAPKTSHSAWSGRLG